MLTLIVITSASAMPGSSQKNAQTYQDSQFSAVPVRLNVSAYSSQLPVNSRLVGPYRGNMSVMVGFSLNNQPSLNSFLAEVSTPGSIDYHHYISRSVFTSRYSPDLGFYDRVLNYFDSFPGLVVRGYGDRLAISISGSSRMVSSAFHSSTDVYALGSHDFYEMSDPGLPGWIVARTSYVAGLQNSTLPRVSLGGSLVPRGRVDFTPVSGGYPAPLGNSILGPQYLWGSDMQRTYNVTGLINATTANASVVATIFWTSGTAPFYPADVMTYFNDTLPKGEPRPKVTAVPLDGAPLPGISAQNDTSGAVLENTLDLEMVGSLDPGASIYNVYTPSSSFAELDESFGYILNPGNSTPGLKNVSVISNSWYSGDRSDPIWNSYLEEAATRGITVVACSGDSGDNLSSPKYVGSAASFPGTDAGSSYGTLSVGGVTEMLNSVAGNSSYLSIERQQAWYSKESVDGKSGYVGTEGGISSFYGEPSWQVNSTANGVLKGRGRGVPDVSAVANDMIIFITVSGVSYYDSPYFYYAWGTSVAAPIVSGIIADLDTFMLDHNGSRAGFIDPFLYNLSNIQYDYMNTNISHFSDFRNPFVDVVNGSNALYSAGVGYDLATGLGTLDAGNLAYDMEYNITYSYYPGNVTSPGSPMQIPVEYLAIIGITIFVAAVAVTMILISGNRRRKD